MSLMEKRKRVALLKLNIPTLNTNTTVNSDNDVSNNSSEKFSSLSHIKVISNNNESLNDKANYNKGPIEILPGLYLGSQRNAYNIGQLLDLGVDSILNVAEEVDSNPNSPSDNQHPKFKYLNLQWKHYQPEIVNYFDRAFEFIDQSRIIRKKKVLVHCQLGISRSATLVIAYIMSKFKYSCTQAYSFLKDKSSKISPNLHLFTQLIQYENFLLEKNTQVRIINKNTISYNNELVQYKSDNRSKRPLDISS